MRNYMLVYSKKNLTPIGYIDSNFQTCKALRKWTSGSIFVLGKGTIMWRSVKQTCMTNSMMETEYVATFEASNEGNKKGAIV